ncbi:MAG: DNA alkylation repair protein [Clostridium sp.]|uniref:DNA alkylation repair protein n=1 Tax=Clostridium sp. TaxID=1506 RepID=UPI00290AC450|nr:DNA alkylation repair protein [Clostridium sp.]MDU7337967.1 DNA alkylation repair protein [Clostridium sp.]
MREIAKPIWDWQTPHRQQLEKLAEDSYREFSQKLLPGTSNILGVRLPILQSLAKQIAKGDWREYLSRATDETFEEIMLQGLVLGNANADTKELFNRTVNFVPKIDNWSVCDSFCASYKLAKKQPDAIWEFLSPYIQSELEFECRFGVVMLLNYYASEKNTPRTLIQLSRTKATGYYAKMAVAWAVSVCFVKNPEATLPYLKQPVWDDFTHNKAIQKILESNRVPSESKSLLRSLKHSV